jgi:hypothetical protein
LQYQGIVVSVTMAAPKSFRNWTKSNYDKQEEGFGDEVSEKKLGSVR